MAMNSNENPVTIVTPRGNPRAEVRADNMMSNTNLACPECTHMNDTNDSAQSPY
jgi:hypothetical protein